MLLDIFYIDINVCTIVKLWLFGLFFAKKNVAVGGDRTHDHKIKSLALYRLS